MMRLGPVICVTTPFVYSTNELARNGELMRYIIYGAGGIGGTIGARLYQSGKEVILIARGAHLKAIEADGLVLADPHKTECLDIPVVGDPKQIRFLEDDVVLLCMKSQDTLDALQALVRYAGQSTTVVCCQNGVANERMALRCFDKVYGVPVILPATHIEPGLVLHHCKGIGGVLDIGNYPGGADETAHLIAFDLSNANFSSQPNADVMRSKYAKLLQNLGNSLQALCNAGSEAADIYRRLIHEALSCYKAAGISCASKEEVRQRSHGLLEMAPIEGHERVGGSSLQSIIRGTGSIEADYLNGEIVLLGKLHGVPTPANRVLQVLANQLAMARGKPGSFRPETVRELIDAHQEP
jgi:2-dehydropantoate 2-reductase